MVENIKLNVVDVMDQIGNEIWQVLSIRIESEMMVYARLMYPKSVMDIDGVSVKDSTHFDTLVYDDALQEAFTIYTKKTGLTSCNPEIGTHWVSAFGLFMMVLCGYKDSRASDKVCDYFVDAMDRTMYGGRWHAKLFSKTYERLVEEAVKNNTATDWLRCDAAAASFSSIAATNIVPADHMKFALSEEITRQNVLKIFCKDLRRRDQPIDIIKMIKNMNYDIYEIGEVWESVHKRKTPKYNPYKLSVEMRELVQIVDKKELGWVMTAFEKLGLFQISDLTAHKKIGECWGCYTSRDIEFWFMKTLTEQRGVYLGTLDIHAQALTMFDDGKEGEVVIENWELLEIMMNLLTSRNISHIVVMCKIKAYDSNIGHATMIEFTKTIDPLTGEISVRMKHNNSWGARASDSLIEYQIENQLIKFFPKIKFETGSECIASFDGLQSDNAEGFDKVVEPPGYCTVFRFVIMVLSIISLGKVSQNEIVDDFRRWSDQQQQFKFRQVIHLFSRAVSINLSTMFAKETNPSAKQAMKNMCCDSEDETYFTDILGNVHKFKS